MNPHIKAHIEQTASVIEALDQAALDEAFIQVKQCIDRGGIIYTCGNGGSGATASHFAGDIMKGLSYGKTKRCKAICLNDNMTALMAISNDASYAEIFVEPLKNMLTPNDVLVALTGSGNSENIIQALHYAKQVGASSVLLCGFDGGDAKPLADCVVHVPVDQMEVAETAHMAVCHALKMGFLGE